jgi:hypothetical protein
MVHKLWKPPELIEEKGETLQRIAKFSKYTGLGKEEQGKPSVYEERTLLKYMLYNQNILTFGKEGKDTFTNSLKELKTERERVGLSVLAKVINKFGYIPEDMAHDVLIPYIRPHHEIEAPARFPQAHYAKFYAYKRAKTLIDLFSLEGHLEKTLWKPRTPEHLEYWTWWELKSRNIFSNWPIISNNDEIPRGRGMKRGVMYSADATRAFTKPEYSKPKVPFIDLHKKEIDAAITKFELQLANFSYEKEGRDIFLKCGLTADWIIAFEIPLPKALELAKKHADDWMSKDILRNYSGIKLPKGGSVETWKANIEYYKRNGIPFKDNTDILRYDPIIVQQNNMFYKEKNIPFKNHLRLLAVSNRQVRQNYFLSKHSMDEIKPSEWPDIILTPTEKLKRRLGGIDTEQKGIETFCKNEGIDIENHPHLRDCHLSDLRDIVTTCKDRRIPYQPYRSYLVLFYSTFSANLKNLDDFKIDPIQYSYALAFPKNNLSTNLQTCKSENKDPVKEALVPHLRMEPEKFKEYLKTHIPPELRQKEREKRREEMRKEVVDIMVRNGMNKNDIKEVAKKQYPESVKKIIEVCNKHRYDWRTDQGVFDCGYKSLDLNLTLCDYNNVNPPELQLSSRLSYKYERFKEVLKEKMARNGLAFKEPPPEELAVLKLKIQMLE